MGQVFSVQMTDAVKTLFQISCKQSNEDSELGKSSIETGTRRSWFSISRPPHLTWQSPTFGAIVSKREGLRTILPSLTWKFFFCWANLYISTTSQYDFSMYTSQIFSDSNLCPTRIHHPTSDRIHLISFQKEVWVYNVLLKVCMDVLWSWPCDQLY